MNKAIKWSISVIALFLVLIIGAVIVVPMVVDVTQYKSKIESLVTNQTGRSFSMGDDIKLSFFPWVGVRLTDLVLGNGPGFKAREMISVKSFEVRLKVMPLLSRQVEVDSFVMDSPVIFLEKNKKGRGNWEEIGPGAEVASGPAKGSEASSESSGELPIASLMVGRLAIVNGKLSYADAASGMTNTLSDLNLELTDISLDKPVTLSFKALADGRPVTLKGTAGPLGRNPGKQDMDLDLTINALETLALKVKGTLLLAGGNPGLDTDLVIEPFSPRALFEKLGQPFPIRTRDPRALDKVALKARVQGTGAALSLSRGTLVLDSSTLDFNAKLQAFNKPDVQFDLSLDTIDLDRYLPPRETTGPDQGADDKPHGGETAQGPAPAHKDNTPAQVDYTPLRRLVLDGKAEIGTVKAANLTMTNVKMQIKGKNGIFDLNPFSMALYQGTSVAGVMVNVQGKTPFMRLNLETRGIQAGPLLKDATGKDIIEGALASDLALTMAGDTPDQIKQSLGGKGVLTFTDGAIVGIDIAGSIRNAAAGIGLGEKSAQKPRTDFAELKIPYQAERGLVTIPEASLVSPLLRFMTQGKTHLVKQDLDFRIEPKLVATLKGQGDTKKRSGLLIPLLVTGTWEHPKIRPDLTGVVKKQLSDPSTLKALIEGKTETGEVVSPKDKVKTLLKGFIE